MNSLEKEYRRRVIQKVSAMKRALEEGELQSKSLNQYERGCFERIHKELVNLSAMRKEVNDEV